MSREYDLYLDQHKENVAKGFYWIRDNLPELLQTSDGFVPEYLEQQICKAHDISKALNDEYDAYDNYFYGKNRSYDVVNDFNYAWLRHVHRNKHHWQYWVLINDDPEEGEIVLDMPYEYILEMICDWWSFSWKSENLREIFKWWDEHKDYIKLSEKTRRTVVDILKSIEEQLDALETLENAE